MRRPPRSLRARPVFCGCRGYPSRRCRPGEFGHEHSLDISLKGASRLIGRRARTVRPSRTGAGAATKVVVFQWPCGTGERSRSPRGDRPRVRAILVEVLVSSGKRGGWGSRSGGPRTKPRAPPSRRGRSCSVATCAFFFVRQDRARRGKAQRVPSPTVRSCSSRRRASISSSVISSVSAIRPRR